ncbi:hypothetical protein B0H13DRAFT_1868508 [Mycena leptocephala]|nr:hypothetical protein B0H13DRAFT_1868508 [Mycena leptocephala]
MAATQSRCTQSRIDSNRRISGSESDRSQNQKGNRCGTLTETTRDFPVIQGKLRTGCGTMHRFSIGSSSQFGGISGTIGEDDGRTGGIVLACNDSATPSRSNNRNRYSIGPDCKRGSQVGDSSVTSPSSNSCWAMSFVFVLTLTKFSLSSGNWRKLTAEDFQWFLVASSRARFIWIAVPKIRQSSSKIPQEESARVHMGRVVHQRPWKSRRTRAYYGCRIHCAQCGVGVAQYLVASWGMNGVARQPSETTDSSEDESSCWISRATIPDLIVIGAAWN